MDTQVNHFHSVKALFTIEQPVDTGTSPIVYRSAISSVHKKVDGMDVPS